MPVPIGMPTPTYAQSKYAPQAAVGSSQGEPQPQPEEAPPNLVPFGRAAKRHAEQGVTQTVNPWAGTTSTQEQFLVPSYGYLVGVYLTIQALGGAGAATAAADSPWSILTNLLFADVNGTPIVNLDGYAAYCMRLYGGYRLFRPDLPGQTNLFAVGQAATNFAPAIFQNTIAANGNFRIPFEIFNEFSRDGLGVLPNMDASAAYKLTITIGAESAVYSVNPATTQPTLSNILEALMRGRPAQVDAYGNEQEQQPPSPGTVQYWTSQTFPVTAGSNTLILSRVGNLIRNHILIFRDATGTRALGETTVMPTVLEFDWDAGQRYILNVTTFRQVAFELNGFDAPQGVVPIQNTTDPNGVAIAEYGDEWMPTVGSTKLQLRFTAGAAGSCQVITNDIVPGAADIYSVPALVYGR
jgi:hypothetical protein